MKQSGKGSKAHTKLTQGGPRDRRSAAGVAGSPKKGGRGGKFTWSGDAGNIPYEASVVAVGDAKDPNFEEAETGEVAAAVAQ